MLGGAAILARREMIEKVGGFDERFHMYAEDNEWCWRITKSDWRLMFVPEAIVAASRRAQFEKALVAERSVTCAAASRV